MSVSTEFSGDMAFWWKSKAGIRKSFIEGIQNGRLCVELSRSKKFQLGYDSSAAEEAIYLGKDESGVQIPWLVTQLVKFGDREWWESPNEDVYLFDPLHIAGLHRTFASLGSNLDRIEGFAQEYGFLGVDTLGVWLDDDQTAWGESTEQWFEEIALINALLQLFDILSGKATLGALSEVIEVDTDRVFFREEFSEQFTRALWADPYDGEAPFPFLAREESDLELLIRGGQELLVYHVSRQLQRTSQPWLKLSKSPQMRLIPTSLLGAIYLHFSNELLGKANPVRRCDSCGIWFQPYSAKKKHCSDACKAKAYRQRKEKQNGS